LRGAAGSFRVLEQGPAAIIEAAVEAAEPDSPFKAAVHTVAPHLGAAIPGLSVPSNNFL
jgi:hypothetical protein